MDMNKFVKLRSQDRAQNAGFPNFCFIFYLIATLILMLNAVTISSDTGEGIAVFNQEVIAQFINVDDIYAEIQAGVGRTSSLSDCVTDGPINCPDPDISTLLMRAAMNKFKDIHFYKFGKPVPGDNDTTCHMAWRYRPKHGEDEDEDESSLYKDYRSFVLEKHENCTISVVSIGDYHSGGNARKRKNKDEVREAVDEYLPVVKTEDSFINGKYLVYYGGGDRCKSMNHYLWSLSCMLGEALYLNRTLVMDISMCLSKRYTSSRVDEEGKDFRFYFDFEHLKRSISLLDKNMFWLEWGKWQEKYELPLHLVDDFRVSPLKLADVKDTLIMRIFGSVEPDNYWYRVCEDDTGGSVIERPWHMIRRSRRLMEMASSIASTMDFDFDALNVKRRYKESESYDLVDGVRGKIEQGRNLYIAATREASLSLFDPLKEKYSIHFLDEFKHLWDSKGEWSNEMKKLNNGISVDFDGYMRDSVDREVFLMGKKQIEIV